MTLTKHDLKTMCEKFEKCRSKVISSRTSGVKARAAESDLLKITGQLRDATVQALKGKKDELDSLYGGDCEVMGRMRVALDAAELSDAHRGDARWLGCKKQLATVREILAQLGQPRTIGAASPSKLVFISSLDVFPLRRQCEISPAVQGQVDEFTVSPSLPASLALDPKTCVISSAPTAETEETAFDITAASSTASATATVRFATKIMPPTALHYPSIDDLYFHAEEVHLEPSVEGGATWWAIEPALPAGMEMDEATGKISGASSTAREETAYTVTASNGAGSTRLDIVFAVAGPADHKYPKLFPGQW